MNLVNILFLFIKTGTNGKGGVYRSKDIFGTKI